MSSIMLTLALVAQTAAPQEVWEPRYAWGCLVSAGKEKSFVVNGFIAQRNEPLQPVPARRFERALRVVRDDSGAFAGLQARSPMFVVHPKQYWAFFKGDDGLSYGPGTRSIILDKDASGLPKRIYLVKSGQPGEKPYATGSCQARILSPEIKQ